MYKRKEERCMKRTGWQNPWVRVITTLMTVAVLFMIFFFSMEDAERSDRRSGMISVRIIPVFHPDYGQLDELTQQSVYDRVQHIVRKCAHFTEFTILGFLLRLCLESWFGHRTQRHRTLALAGLGAGAAYACTDEMHQMTTAGRSGQWTDVLVDSCGVFCGVLLGTLLIKSLKRISNEECEQLTLQE